MAKRGGGSGKRGGGNKPALLPALELCRQLAAGRDPAPCTVLQGAESYLAQRCLTALRARVLGDPPGPGLAEFDGHKADLAPVLDELRTLPFLGAGARLVVVEKAGKNGNLAGFAQTHGEALAAYLARPTATSSLVLVCDKLDGRFKATQTLLGASEVVDCGAFDEAGLRGFLGARAEELGRPFAPRAAAALLDRLGGQDVTLAQLDAEVAKLATAGEGPITIEQVEALASFGSSEQAFGLIDRIAQGDVEGALGILQRLLRDGLISSGGSRTREASGIGMILLPTLRWDLDRVIKGRGMLDRGVRGFEVARELRVFSRDRETFLARAQRASPAELRDRHALLRRADLALRSSADPAGTLADVVVTLALAERSRAPARR